MRLRVLFIIMPSREKVINVEVNKRQDKLFILVQQ